MTIWVLHLPLTPEEEAHVRERTHLELPFGTLPDLARVGSSEQCRHLLKGVYPDDPPELITRRLDYIWSLYSAIAREDVIAVPLPHCQEVALAEITDHYQYRVCEDGSDLHLMQVKWVAKSFSIRGFGKHADIFRPASPPMVEVMRKDARIAIRDRLPHSYNRFVKWKWLLAIFFILNMLRFLMRMQHS